jgi:proteasome accessory factor B
MKSGDFVKQNRLSRQNRIAQLLYLNPGGLTAQQIAKRVGVNARTVYRDLWALQNELQVPLWQDGPRWGTDHAEFLPPLKLTLREAVTLFLGTRLMARFQDRGNPDVISAYRKLATILPEPVARHVDATTAAMAQRRQDGHQARLVAILATAWAEGRKVRIAYPRAGDAAATEQRLVSPYFLEPSPTGHSHYLIAHDDGRGALRTFRLERIQGAELTDERFTIPDDFDATARFDRTWGIADDPPLDVRLLFHAPAAAARARETRWHSSQREVARPDGKLELHFTAGGLHEISHWVLTWGDTVEVLAPPVLRERMAAIAISLAARYEN